ncbi:MAG: tetratricopeptide repeat protein, partial [Planctomycetes bacterium]|nr:tetratricopeptide repeat protein [Planctomycetota bacterium]
DAQATIADHTGEFDRAKELFTASARLYAEAGRESSMLQARGNLATVLAASGRRPEALKILQELIPRFETLNDPRAAAVARSNVAKQLLMLGLHEDAEREFLAALEAHRGNGVRRSEAFALANLADVWRHLGKLDQAEQAVLQAVEIAREVGQPVYSAAYLATHAGLLLLTGREREAQQRLEESRAEFEAGGGRRYIPEYCDIWRLRVAASQACTGGGTPRGTSRLAAGPVAPRWVRAAELILQGMESAAGSTNDLALAIEAGRRVVAELRTAEREKQPALLWRGHLPSDLSPPLRRALLARMEKRQGTGLEALRRLHPALVAALESG